MISTVSSIIILSSRFIRIAYLTCLHFLYELTAVFVKCLSSINYFKKKMLKHILETIAHKHTSSADDKSHKYSLSH